MDRSGVERRWIDRQDVSEESAKVVAGTAMATVTETAMDAMTMVEGVWEDPPATRGLGQNRGRDPPRAAAGRGLGVTPPRERRRQDQEPGRGQGMYQYRVVGGCGEWSGRSGGGGGAIVARNYNFCLIWRCYGPKRDILDY